MRVNLALAVVVFGFTTLGRAVSAEACSCAGVASSATAFSAADLVFVGTVGRLDGPKPRSRMNADGSFSGGPGVEAPVVTFEVAQVFKGGATNQVVVVGDGSNCDEPFKPGESWLVYASKRGGRVTTDKCTRTRLRAAAATDLVYLEGLQRGRRQGLVHGNVLRRIVKGNGEPALQALFEPLTVIAVGGGARVETTTDRWGPYQLVLPPGDFQIWVERAGRAVSPRHAIHVDHGATRELYLAVAYRD
jgi:hypothetical protein